jgi:four helix bundle suffix protein
MIKNPKIPKSSKTPNSEGRPGYEYLSAYMLGKVIQDLTDQFCRHFLKNPNDPNFPNFKLIEQMNGAARSNPQNIAEGFTQKSLKGYIKLAGVAQGSNEELAKDYQDFLRQRKLPIWEKTHPKIRKFREFRAVWVSPTSLNTPTLPKNPQEAANLLLTFCQMEGYLLKRLVDSLTKKHRTEGGLTEKLYKARTEYRGY